MISRSFISFTANSARGDLLRGRVLRDFGGLVIVGDVSGSCNMPKLELKIVTASSARLASRLGGSISV